MREDEWSIRTGRRLRYIINTAVRWVSKLKSLCWWLTLFCVWNMKKIWGKKLISVFLCLEIIFFIIFLVLGSRKFYKLSSVNTNYEVFCSKHSLSWLPVEFAKVLRTLIHRRFSFSHNTLLVYICQLIKNGPTSQKNTKRNYVFVMRIHSGFISDFFLFLILQSVLPQVIHTMHLPLCITVFISVLSEFQIKNTLLTQHIFFILPKNSSSSSFNFSHHLKTLTMSLLISSTVRIVTSSFPTTITLLCPQFIS